MAIFRRKKVETPAPAKPPPNPPTRVGGFARDEDEDEPQHKTWKVQVDQLNEGAVVAAGIAALRWEDKTEFDKLVLRVRPDSFQIPEHQKIWAALMRFRRDGLEFEIEALRRFLGETMEESEQLVEHVSILIETRDEFPPNIDYFVDNLDWDKARAEATRGPVQELLEALQDVQTPRERTQALAKQVVTTLSDGVSSVSLLRSPVVVVNEAADALEERMRGQAIHAFGLPGFDVDTEGEVLLRENGMPRVAPGADPGSVTVVTSVRGMGKSTLVRALTSAMIDRGRRILYGAWEEDDARKVLPMIAAYRLGIPRGRVIVGNFTRPEADALRKEMEKIGSVIRFVENPRRTGRARSSEEVVDFIHRSLAESACDVFIGDLLRRAFRFQSVDDEEEALFKLQAVAKETQVHMIWAQQQRAKETETRRDPRPTLEGVKGPGAWTEVADNVFGVFRPAIYKNVPDEELQVHVLKQRDGAAPLLVAFEFDPTTGFLLKGEEREYDRRRFSEDDDAAIDPALQPRKRRRVGPRAGA